MASTTSSTALTFGLVSVPVAVKKVKVSGDSEFKTADADGRPCGRIWAVKSEDAGGEPRVPTDLESLIIPPFVPNEKGELRQDVTSAVEVGGKYRPLPKDALKAINLACAIDGIEIQGFIPVADVPFERVEGCYYLAPAKGMGAAAAKPLALLRDALALSGRAGYGKLTFRPTSGLARQHAFVVYPKFGGLLLDTVAFAEDFAQTAEVGEVLAGVAAEEKHVAMATTLIESLSATVADLDALVDDARERRAELVEKAVNGEVIEVPEKAAPAEPSIDLEAALTASLAGPKAKGKAKAKAAA